MKQFCLAALVLGISVIADAQSGAYSNLIEYPLPFANSAPMGIAVGPDGALWFGESAVSKIGRITTAGVITEYATPTPKSSPSAITAGSDGALWFTEFESNQIGRITTGGVITEYAIPTAGSEPNGIAAGPDGALWFTEEQGIKIGRITTTGAITEYPLVAEDGNPWGITAGPDGALWFTQNEWVVGRMTTGGEITMYPVSSYAQGGITTGPDGALWFPLYNGGMGRLTTAGVFSEIQVGYFRRTVMPQVTVGPDGALWFTNMGNWLGDGNQFGRLTLSGIATQYHTPAIPTYPYGITAGPDGAMWFTEVSGNKIARAPACGLGLRSSFASGTLTMNFHVGINVPATLGVHLSNADGPIGQTFSQPIPATVPPQPFTTSLPNFPNKGVVTVTAMLATTAGDGLCAEWTTVDTTQ